MLGLRFLVAALLFASACFAEDLAQRPPRNIDLMAAAEDGLTVEEFDRMEREAIDFADAGVNPEESDNLFEGDIIPTFHRNAMTTKQKRWPGGVVPYMFERDVSRSSQAKIRNALASLMSKVNSGGKCLTIRPTTSRDRDYVGITYSGGCSSHIGRTGGKQRITLGRGCYTTGTIQHEFMHALGFYHEQSRSDRDRYVTILWNNINKKYQSNFRLATTDNQGKPYDYGSVMHYGATAFSTNGKPTIQPKTRGARIGQRTGVSAIDVQEIRQLYGC